MGEIRTEQLRHPLRTKISLEGFSEDTMSSSIAVDHDRELLIIRFTFRHCAVESIDVGARVKYNLEN